MRQDYEKVIKLIGNYNAGTIDDPGKKELEQWLGSDPENQLLFNHLTSEEGLRTELKVMHHFNAAAAFSRFEGRYIRPVQRLWLKIVAAAVVLMIVGLGGYFYYDAGNSGVEKALLRAQAISPGRNAATLTLANGKKIVLDEAGSGALAEEAGVVITKRKEGQLIYEIKDRGRHAGTKNNSLSTARGETYRLRLPDGTLVWINAATTLSYPASFAGMKTRTVKLNGEAYFEVSKDKSHPFIVETAKQQVRVLGTHFNINSYADEGQTLTTLLEGAVEINDKTVLKPGEQARLADNGNLSVAQANVEEAMGWKNGFFLFDKDDLPTVMRQISRWYDINVKYEGAVPKASFDGKVYRNLNLSKALEVLKYANVRFRLEGKTIIILP
ncbi:FecR family protein [Pedobacter africanus]|uniref:FecR family protein n=1 Tax=Pedobacter africanus TaxID=151894 RepID=A0A1W1YXK5_9SPHI|nr:FecR family protein [Pedobacter africanus]SMC40925.1 FecR family protein [Pedobacter africanus]